MKRLLQIKTSYFCCGLIIDNGHVEKAAPIMHWAVGQPWSKVKNWIQNQEGTIRLVENRPDRGTVLESFNFRKQEESSSKYGKSPVGGNPARGEARKVRPDQPSGRPDAAQVMRQGEIPAR